MVLGRERMAQHPVLAELIPELCRRVPPVCMADGAIVRLVIRLRAAAAAQNDGKAWMLPVAVLDAANELLETVHPRGHTTWVSKGLDCLSCTHISCAVHERIGALAAI